MCTRLIGWGGGWGHHRDTCAMRRPLRASTSPSSRAYERFGILPRMPTNDAATEMPASGPGLVWGVKRSLIAYISRLPDGKVFFDDGVRLTADYHFQFPLGVAPEFDQVTGAGVIRFGGFVHLAGHLGAMAVTLARPSLHVDGRGGRLSFEAPGARGAQARRVLFDIVMERPCAVDGLLSWRGLRPTLTQEGADVFESNYSAGTEFDPISVRVQLAR